MEMQFTRHEPVADKIVLVLTLDKQKMKERLLIGRELDIRFQLEGHKDTDLLCDITRPLGTFFSKFDYDSGSEWNEFGIAPLYQAMCKNRWEQPALEKAAGDFLAKKYLTGNPVSMYIAFRIWNEYLRARLVAKRNVARDLFMDKMGRLTVALQSEHPLRFDPDTGKPKQFDISRIRFGSVPAEETRLTLWYPDNRIHSECISADESIYPMITYYLNRLNEWGLYFRKCKVCRKIFLAKSQKYELCSEKCRKAQALQNKREFDERARDNNYDLLYKNECQNWRNKINKVKKNAVFPADRLENMKLAFDSFKADALQRKKLVKTGKASPKEFTDWLYQQSSIIAELADY